MKQINWPMFQRVVAAINAHPGNWKQSSWHCGTSHCFAGFAHILDLQDRGVITCPLTQVESEDVEEIELYGEESWHVALNALGITDRQSDWLFYRTRTISDFQECIARRCIPIYDDEGFTVWPGEAQP